MEVVGESRRNIKKRVMEVLDLVGLKHKVRSFPNELSGGEQQRIGIVRAIIAEPKILLMDEPFSALDAISRKQLQALTKKLHKEFGMTTIINTHDMNSVMGIGENICFIYKGKKEWQGTKDDVMSSKNQKLNDLVFASDLFRKVKEVEEREEANTTANKE